MIGRVIFLLLATLAVTGCTGPAPAAPPAPPSAQAHSGQGLQYLGEPGYNAP